jgi:hypothetical protein
MIQSEWAKRWRVGREAETQKRGEGRGEMRGEERRKK